jgi:hypothetical protein
VWQKTQISPVWFEWFASAPPFGVPPVEFPAPKLCQESAILFNCPANTLLDATKAAPAIAILIAVFEYILCFMFKPPMPSLCENYHLKTEVPAALQVVKFKN